MSTNFVVSRRRAAMFIAGAFAGSAGPAAAATAVPQMIDPGEAPQNDHRRIATLLQSVRRAGGIAARARAFERCKAALRDHDSREALAASYGVGCQVGKQALYRHIDPSTVLANVIVRELDAWPQNEGGWLERFGDLEAAFRTHVAAHGPLSV